MIPLDTIRQSANLLSIAQTYGLKLRKSGVQWTAPCPFHREHTAGGAFHIHPAKNVYYCQSCGAEGDVFTLVQHLESLPNFPAAARRVAELSGVPLPDWTPEQRRQYREQRARAEEITREAEQFWRELRLQVAAETVPTLPDTEPDPELLGAHALAADAFRRALPEAQGYLHSRGITRAEAERFGIGYACPIASVVGPNVPGLTRDGKDLFRNRLMFPIHDPQGRVIAFGGRALSSTAKPKYLNSPETPIYRKSEVVYNLHRAIAAAPDRLVLVEGYMDVIAATRAGVPEAVATSGATFAPAQARLLRCVSDRVVVSLDSDAAGLKATEHCLPVLLDEGLLVRVATLTGKDPDAMTAEAYRAALDGAVPCFRWLVERWRGRVTDPMACYESLMPVIQRIPVKEMSGIAAGLAGMLGVEAHRATYRYSPMAESKLEVPPITGSLKDTYITYRNCHPGIVLRLSARREADRRFGELVVAMLGAAGRRMA
jgi:DNA primase